MDKYTATQLHEITGLSKRKIQFYIEKKLIVSLTQDKDKKGKGNKRYYYYRALVLLAVITELRKLNLSVEHQLPLLSKAIRKTEHYNEKWNATDIDKNTRTRMAIVGPSSDKPRVIICGYNDLKDQILTSAIEEHIFIINMRGLLGKLIKRHKEWLENQS